MTTLRLDEDRWFWAAEEVQKPRIALTDAIVANQPPVIPKWNDYDNLDPSVLDVMANHLNAITYDDGGTVQSKRNALKQTAIIHRQLGTENAYTLLMESVQSVGTFTYVTGQPGDATTTRKYAVRLFVAPPTDRQADSAFLAYVLEAAKRVWPFWIIVLSAQVLVQDSTVKMYNTLSDVIIDYSGWPDGS